MAAPSLKTDLPWQGLAAQGNVLSGLGGDPQQMMAQLGSQYNNSYQSILGMNAALGTGVQTNYDKLRSSVDQQYGDIAQGYQQHYGDVLGRIAGANDSNLRDITSNYNAFAGQAAQNAVSRGLGNTTIAGNMQRAVAMDRERAQTNSKNTFATTEANFANSIGLAGLQSRQHGADLGASLGQAQIGALERTNIPYPDAGMYMNLAKMYGAQREADSNRQQAQQLMNPGAGRINMAGGGAPSSGSLGYGPMRPGMAFEPGVLGGGYMGGGGYAAQPRDYSSLGFSSGGQEWDYGLGDGSIQGTPEGAFQGSGEGGYLPGGSAYSGGYGTDRSQDYDFGGMGGDFFG